MEIEMNTVDKYLAQQQTAVNLFVSRKVAEAQAELRKKVELRNALMAERLHCDDLVKEAKQKLTQPFLASALQEISDICPTNAMIAEAERGVKAAEKLVRDAEALSNDPALVKKLDFSQLAKEAEKAEKADRQAALILNAQMLFTEWNKKFDQMLAGTLQMSITNEVTGAINNWTFVDRCLFKCNAILKDYRAENGNEARLDKNEWTKIARAKIHEIVLAVTGAETIKAMAALEGMKDEKAEKLFHAYKNAIKALENKTLETVQLRRLAYDKEKRPEFYAAQAERQAALARELENQRIALAQRKNKKGKVSRRTEDVKEEINHEDVADIEAAFLAAE